MIRESVQLILTVFVMSLLIHEDVGLHVPDELVGQKLRGLCSPQDVLSHIAHLSREQGQSSVTLQMVRRLVFKPFCQFSECKARHWSKEQTNVPSCQWNMTLPYRNAKPGQSEEYRTGWRPEETKIKILWDVFLSTTGTLEFDALQQSVSYRRKGAQYFDPVLSSERMRRVHAAEVGEAGGRVCRSPTQDVAQLRRVCVNGVPRHQKLRGKRGQSGKEGKNKFW